MTRTSIGVSWISDHQVEGGLTPKRCLGQDNAGQQKQSELHPGDSLQDEGDQET